MDRFSSKSVINDRIYLAFWSPCLDTVRQLYEVLLENKLVHVCVMHWYTPSPSAKEPFSQVRGTPGCGKTTLMTLLHAHIVDQLPLAVVKIVHSWKRIESNQVFDQRLREIDPAFPRRDSLAFLPSTRGKTHTAMIFFGTRSSRKSATGFTPHYRVIMFCSYGSPSSRIVSYDIGSPPILRKTSRISLWPVAGKSPIGILLPRFEFMEVASKAEGKLNLHPDLLDLIFIWTVGHVGAVVELLRILSVNLSYQPVVRVS